MKQWLAGLACAALSAGIVAAQQGDDPDRIVKGTGAVPSGWEMRLDRAHVHAGAAPHEVGLQFSLMGKGFHFVTGPAGIFYKPDMTKSGAYEVHATFAQGEAAAHPEGYGLFVGGSDLQGANQKYTYFLIRQDGKFILKRRAGAETPTIMNWTDHAAIKKTDASTKGTNTLAVAVATDKVRFLINGTEVATAAPADVDTSGIVGVRVNHNLNVHVENFGVK